MRQVALAAVFLFVCPLAFAQHHMHHTASPAREDNLRESVCSDSRKLKDAVDQPELREVNWEVTGNTDGKMYFRQGMTQYYGFNYEEALRNFRGAKKADPSMAMAYWGIALAAGPNINLGMDKTCHDLAISQSDEARSLAKKQGLTSVERALIDALPLRYDYPVTDPKATQEMAALQAYSDALGERWKKNKKDPAYKTYRADANFGALYAESLIELHPWALYDNHFKPSSDTSKVLSVLRTAMKADPKAVGANHYWIHTVEASANPGSGRRSADLLVTLVPPSGHLVHMPSHIYLLLGEFTKALASNVDASQVDVTEYAGPCRGSFEEYSKSDTCPQLYYGHYLSHNFFFGSVSATFSGQSATAMAMACDTQAHVERFVTNEPGLQHYMTAPLMTLVVNRNWKAIEDYPEPLSECYIQAPFTVPTGCHILKSIWNWAKGFRYATLGETSKADASYQAMVSEKEATECKPPGTVCDGPAGWGNNRAVTVLDVAQSILKARIAWAKDPQDPSPAINALKEAVENENLMTYDEPPQWFAPARESLGGAYLQIKAYRSALRTFNKELERHPKSGRALYGKLRVLVERHATPRRINSIKKQYCEAWKYADYAMTDADLWPVRSGNGAGGITCDEKPKPEPSKCICKAQTLASPTLPTCQTTAK